MVIHTRLLCFCITSFFYSQIYDKPLENVEIFNGFQDFVSTFHFSREKVKADEEATSVGEFKAREILC